MKEDNMSKIKLELKAGPLPILGIYPTIIIGTVVDGKTDFTTVAWTGVAASVPPAITIALQHHRHSLKGIREHMNFSVNIPSVDQVKEADYCGIVTGARVDKAADCRFNVFYGQLATAPFIEQCPVNHACEVVQVLNLGSHELIVGRIIETHVSEECLTDGRVDIAKVQPFTFAGRSYFATGKFIGEPFSCGKEINPETRPDSPDIPKKGTKKSK